MAKYKDSQQQRGFQTPIFLQAPFRLRQLLSRGHVVLLVRMLSGYAKVAGSMSSQGTYKNQP